MTADALRLTRALPGTGGILRSSPDDFEVEEIPAYAPSGEGEHLFLWIEKVGLDTPEAAFRVASTLGLRLGEVSWAGLKDRVARTRQWLSVPARTEPALGDLASTPELRLLSHARHGNKLRVGHLRGNRFRIRIREAERPDAAGPVMERLVAEGLPNAFGEQRFGRGDTAFRGRALVHGERLPARPNAFERKLYVSAYQALLFNRILEARLRDGALRRALPGDLMRKTDSGGLFVCREPEVDQGRVERGEIVATGPIFGWKMQRPEGESEVAEQAVLAAEGLTLDSFRRLGGIAEGTRRPFAVPVADARWSADGSTVELSFTLPAGSYATVLLDEVMKREDRREDAAAR
ncbi:MAG TPA: tRNA pseudouridine(13) synthase TruD [Myxococcaceae bacterium]|nr:tRNA pseudouridine(13) synthase TruD [Myxococcaceae bacterium]